jgi:hypothetical protein
MPTEWWPDVESANALIESEGPWPSSSPQTNARFLALDVDRHGGLAVIVGFGPNRRGREVLRSEEFKRAAPESGIGSRAVAEVTIWMSGPDSLWRNGHCTCV